MNRKRGIRDLVTEDEDRRYRPDRKKAKIETITNTDNIGNKYDLVAMDDGVPMVTIMIVLKEQKKRQKQRQ